MFISVLRGTTDYLSPILGNDKIESLLREADGKERDQDIAVGGWRVG